MYIWRFSIAMILGLVWYFSDCGQVVAQIVLCLLFWPTTPNFFIKTGRESGTQTYDVAEDNSFQETLKDEHLGCGVTDTRSTKAKTSQETQFPHVRRSLQQVFECAYAQLVLPWYCVPEPCDSQLLHEVLWREFDQVIDQVISRGKDFDVCAASVGCIRILTQHLHSAKQSDREPLFSSRGEEVEVLRVFSEALVRNLFPQSLWGLAVSHCALNEIVALKVLDLLVRWLSDPDNLNQLVVSQLVGVTPKSSVEDLCESNSDRASPATLESQASEATLEETENAQTGDGKSKKKANKLKEGWSKILDKMKSKKDKRKKMKKKEQVLVVRAKSIQDCPSKQSEGSSRECSIQSQQDPDSVRTLHQIEQEDGDLESYLTSVQEEMMEFKLSYEMWRVGHWAVSVPHMERKNEGLCFTVHLEERDNPENLHWDVRKTQTDIIHFCNLWQDSANLPSLSVLEASTEGNSEDFREARTSLKLFLQELVSDALMGHTQPVFQFLCPLDKLLSEEEHVGGVWGLLSGLAYFLTPGQEEDEEKHNTLQRGTKSDDSNTTENADPTATEKLDENIGDTRDGSPSEPNSIECCRGKAMVPVEKSDCLVNAGKTEDKIEESENPVTSHLKMINKELSRSEECLAQTKSDNHEDQTNSVCRPRHFSQNGGSQYDLADSPSWCYLVGKSNKKEKLTFKMSGGIHRSKGKDMGSQSKLEDSQCLKKNQSSWEQMEATKAIFDLLKAISGNSILLNIFDAILKPVMPILKKKVNSFLNKMNPTDAQMASYIDNLCEKQWPEGSPEMTSPKPHRNSEEKNETKDRAQHLINARYSNYLILKKTDMETVFKLFQDCEENKKLVYMLLSFLLRELLPGEDVLNVSAITLQKVNAN
ncbi:uncharacterized protein si:rp71-46j2.7 isoform X1 [Salvelinus fontinalis]|uniref:uncharacterized protein si:rp71-46j2.7 isoform X1 n=1 Tax=Salvelinus fontinalis TaxID=8038 RepID=UPI0024861D59|nr:uncharacterized protein si:rp71-46j2.7 isoform X1 [Salvelinus fontinalis]